MTDDQYDTIIARLDGLQAEMETGFAAVNATLSTLAIGQVNLFNLLMRHLDDHRRGAA